MDVDPPAEARPAEPTADAPDTATSPSSGGLAVRVPNRFRPEPIAPPPRWYGWQTLLADGAGVALLVVGAGLVRLPALRQCDLYCYMPGAVTFGLGTPVLHGRHDAGGRAVASGLARMLGVPVLMLGAALVQVAQSRCHSSPLAPVACTPPDDSGSNPTVPLLVGGIAGAGISALDAVFAWSTSPPPVVTGGAL